MADVIDSTAEEMKPGAAASRPGGYRRLTAALVGGVIGGALVLVGGFLFLPDYVQGRIEAAVADLRPSDEAEQRIVALEQRTHTLAGLDDRAQELTQQIDAVQASVAELGGRLEQATDQAQQQEGTVGTLQSTQQELASRVAELEGRPVPEVPDLGPLHAQIENATKDVQDLRAFGEQLAARVSEATSTTDATLRRVDTLTTAQAEADRRATERAQALADRMTAAETAMSARFADLNQAEATLSSLQSTLASQASQIAALEAGASDLESQAQQGIAAVGDKIGALEQRVDERLAQDSRGAATALALSELNDALADGSAFPTAQAVLEKSSADDATIASAAEKLRPSAATGVPTRAALLEQLGELDRVAAAASSDDWVEQTRSNILGLVTVKRRDGTVVNGGEDEEGNSAQQKLAAGDLAGAIAAVEARSDKDEPEVAAWLQRAKARADAEAAAELLRQHLGELLVRPS
ncbi:hypothetical protein [Geminicoccus harenae]|uniref:hypothetical protein n=2 Tax=Geminicoccus harenae TaxID=2498453 RepID=UPI001C958F28|nr:hypothetical protein [Geminicoccus harenae]